MVAETYLDHGRGSLRTTLSRKPTRAMVEENDHPHGRKKKNELSKSSLDHGHEDLDQNLKHMRQMWRHIRFCLLNNNVVGASNLGV